MGTTTTTYQYDANRSLPVVLTDRTLKYVWGVGLAYATDTSGNVQDVYHTDGQGSVRAITNASGSITQTYQTDEFGVPALTHGTVSQPFRYTGEQRDGESSFVFLRARSYWPALERFLSRDTIVAAITNLLALNRYTFVHDNPASLVDPSGHQEAYADEIRRMEGEGPLLGGGLASATSPEEEAAAEANSIGDQAVNALNRNSYEYLSQQIGPLEGWIRWSVYDPDTGQQITDIDFIEGKIFWEDKLATRAINPITGADQTARFVSDLADQFGRYLRARQYLGPFYQDAAIGFRFTSPGVDPAFKAAVEAEVSQLRSSNPDVTIFLQWGS